MYEVQMAVGTVTFPTEAEAKDFQQHLNSQGDIGSSIEFVPTDVEYVIA